MNKYLIVSNSVLPDYFEKVVDARELTENSDYSISRACEEKGISRSTYYKYKDNIFRPNNDYGKKSIFAFKMADEKGVLSSILSVIYDFNANIIAINQAMPIKNNAYVTITIDVSDTLGNLQDLAKKFKQLKYVKGVSILAFD